MCIYRQIVLNGFSVCDSIREFDTSVPIILLTARSQVTDKVRGLDIGADDYVTKPFSIEELIARVKAHLRRSIPGQKNVLSVGPCRIDLSSHTMERNGIVQTLSFYEVELLRLLHEKIGKPVSREEIFEKVWGMDGNSTNRTVDNFIVKLRKKIEYLPEKPEHILTVYGFGYKLVLSPSGILVEK